MSWKNIKLGDVIKHRKGSILIDDEVEYKLCRVQLHRKGVLLREIVKGKTIRTKKQQVCKAGDFLVAEMDAKVGGYGFVPEELHGAIVSSHYFLFELDEKKIRPKFLEVISQLQILQDQIKAVGSTNYAAIRPANVLNWEIPITTIAEQIEIEKLFDSVKYQVRVLSSELTHQLTLVKKLRQQLLHDAVQGKLVAQNPKDEPASELLKKIKAEKQKLVAEKKLKKEKELPPIKPEEIPFEIPKNWVWCRLGEICTKIHYGFNASAKPEKKDVRLLRITDIQENKVDWESVPGCDYTESDLKIYSLSRNDIMIARTGGTIGKTFLVNDISVKSLFASYLIRAVPSKNIVAEYLKFFLESPIYWKQLYDAARGAGQPNVNGTSLSNLKVPLPPIEDQNLIVRKLDELMQYCNDLEASIKESESQNEKLLQQVLREALRKE
jgi:restriction endonuclease S subunit